MAPFTPTRGPGAESAETAGTAIPFRREDGGQAIVLIAIVMLAMIFAIGLSIDSGQLFNGRRTAQEAADAGAFAGAVVLYQNGTVAQAITAATADASINGYATDTPSAGTTVVVNSPPTSGSYSGNAICIEVVVTTVIRTTLVPQQAGFTTVRAQGVACSVANSQGYAVMATDQACDSGAAALSANGVLAIHGGGIEINSCSATAGQNSGTITMDAGYHTDVVGSVAGSWPNLQIHQDVEADPFAGIAKPSTNGLTAYSPACPPAVNQPGIYTTTFSSNCDYVFAPGTYIFKGGGWNLSGNSSACTGPSCTVATAAGGVFLFFTNSNYPASGGSCAQVKLTGNGASTLSPPTSGTYQGMLLWQDSACTADLQIGGGGLITTTGSIYAPAAKVSGNGNGSTVTASQIIAKYFDTQNANFTVTYSTSVTYQPRIPALVE